MNRLPQELGHAEAPKTTPRNEGRKPAHGDPAAPAILRSWRAKNPRAPKRWREIATRLADDPDMEKVWRGIGGKNTMAVFTSACDADAKARVEMHRPPSDEEKQGIQGAVDALESAKEAVERSALPRRSAVLFEVARGKESLPVWLGWRDKPTGLGPSMTLTGFLELAARLIGQHEAKLPTRAVLRARGDPEASAFVRWLTWFLSTRRISLTPTQLAHIGNAIFERHETRSPALGSGPSCAICPPNSRYLTPRNARAKYAHQIAVDVEIRPMT